MRIHCVKRLSDEHLQNFIDRRFPSKLTVSQGTRSSLRCECTTQENMLRYSVQGKILFESAVCTDSYNRTCTHCVICCEVLLILRHFLFRHPNI
jgi:hypothetical protein